MSTVMACRGLTADDASIDACLTALLKNCENTAHAMTHCAAHAERMALQLLLARRAAIWHRWAGELAALRSDGAAARSLRSAHAEDTISIADLSDESDAALLAVCEQHESRAMHQYRQALEEDIPRIMRAVLVRHVEGIHDSLAQMRRLGADPSLEQRSARPVRGEDRWPL